MADTTTTNYGLTKPEVGASADTWGTKLNTNLDTLDTTVDSIQGKSGAATLKHTDSAKLTTTATGIDVTGNVTMATGGSIVAGGVNDLILNEGESGTPDIYLQSGGSTKVKIEGSNGNVGIAGQTNPTYKLDGGFADQTWGWYLNSSYNAGFTYNTTERSLLISTKSAENIDHIKFATGGAATERMRIDSSGNVGIGNSSPVELLTIGSTSDTNVRALFLSSTTGAGTIQFGDGTGASAYSGYINYTHSDNALAFATGSAERARLDSSGNWLVGKSANNLTSDGIVLRGSGELFVTRAGDVATFNRRGGTGDIVRFAANSTTVGAIRSDADSIGIGSGNVGLLFYNAGDRIIPRNEVGTSDGALDLGFSSDRFKDLYLSEGISLSADDGGGVGSNTIGFKHTGHTAGYAAAIAASYSGDYRANLIFKINTSQSNTAPVEVARFNNGGNLLVGTTNVSASVGEGIKFRTSSNGKTISTVSSRSTSADEGITMWSTGANTWRFYVGWGGKINATSNTIQAISDQRFKENIRDLDDGLSKVMELRPRKFDWKEGKGADIKDDRGFIAQEFEEVFPDLVGEWKDEAPEGEEPYKAVSQDLIPTLVKAIQEQQTLIESLTTRIAALEE